VERHFYQQSSDRHHELNHDPPARFVHIPFQN
jgi:hypothetical protein